MIAIFACPEQGLRYRSRLMEGIFGPIDTGRIERPRPRSASWRHDICHCSLTWSTIRLLAMIAELAEPRITGKNGYSATYHNGGPQRETIHGCKYPEGEHRMRTTVVVHLEKSSWQSKSPGLGSAFGFRGIAKKFACSHPHH